MKKYETFIYTVGTFFYISLLVFGFGLFIHLMIDRDTEDKFIEVDQAAKEVVDGIEELHLAVELDLKALEEKYEG